MVNRCYCYRGGLCSFRHGRSLFVFEETFIPFIFVSISFWTRWNTKGEWGITGEGQKGTRKIKSKEIGGRKKKHIGGGAGHPSESPCKKGGQFGDSFHRFYLEQLHLTSMITSDII